MTSTHPFFSFLKERIRQPLPGKQAHLQMAPSPLNGAKKISMTPEGRPLSSGVMILLYTEMSHLHMLLTIRNLSLVHGGQISFPGGRSEPNEHPEETALREMKEEIGIDPDKVSVIGRLSKLYLSHSNNLITPVIGIHRVEPEIQINPDEVQEVFTVSLETLLKERSLVTEQWELRKSTYKVPFWDIHQVPLWGATAMMTNELLSLYREFLLQT